MGLELQTQWLESDKALGILTWGPGASLALGYDSEETKPLPVLLDHPA